MPTKEWYAANREKAQRQARESYHRTRDKRLPAMREYKAANRDALRAYGRNYDSSRDPTTRRAQAAKPERRATARAWKRADYARRGSTYKNAMQQLSARRGICPLCCEHPVWNREKSTCCRRCFKFLQWLHGTRGVPIKLLNHNQITPEDIQQWQNVTTQRKATALRKRLLRQLETTRQSQTSGKNPTPLA